MAPTRTDAAYTGAWLSSRLGIEPRKLDLRRRGGELLAVPADADASDWVYPAWQFDRAFRPIPAVGRVLGAGREAGLSPQELDAVLQRRDGLTGKHRLVDSLFEGHEEHVLAVIRAAG
jgi:hypothetical protein